MRDYWVPLFLLFFLVQLPLCYFLGKDDLRFEYAITDVEVRLKRPMVSSQDKVDFVAALQHAEDVLDQVPNPMCRLARIELARGTFEWENGKVDDAMQAMETARELFEKHHGQDSFYFAATNMRLAEMFFFRSEYPEAEALFRRSATKVREYLGPDNIYLSLIHISEPTRPY